MLLNFFVGYLPPKVSWSILLPKYELRADFACSSISCVKLEGRRAEIDVFEDSEGDGFVVIESLVEPLGVDGVSFDENS